MAPVNTNTTAVTPKTWATGDALTQALMNVHLRDNLNALSLPANGYSIINLGADLSTTSTIFTDVDSTNLKLQFTSSGRDIWVHLTASVYSVATAVRMDFDIDLDGARQAGDDGICVTQLNTNPYVVNFDWIIDAPSAASHTIKLQWKVNAGTGGMYAGAGTPNFDVHPIFFAREV